jgi:hypothetical protein
MILGGRVAAEFRQIVLGVFNRYMAGDRSMITEIHSNAASSAPIHQAYRQALAQEPVTTMTGTRPMFDHDEALFNLELHERQMALHERQMALHERSWALYEKSLALQKRVEFSLSVILSILSFSSSLNACHASLPTQHVTFVKAINWSSSVLIFLLDKYC